MTADVRVRDLGPADLAWERQVLSEAWSSTRMVSRGRLTDLVTLPGLVAEWQDQRAGLLTYRIEGRECEVTSLNSRQEGLGVGTALMLRVREIARAAGCRRVWLVTSNDNLPALKFYQRRGYELVAVHRGAIDAARALKPEIAPIGLYGIPVRDEIELEIEVG
jgi:ribosomal protein S18 acetylase RimI-like enzyme